MPSDLSQDQAAQLTHRAHNLLFNGGTQHELCSKTGLDLHGSAGARNDGTRGSLTERQRSNSYSAGRFKKHTSIRCVCGARYDAVKKNKVSGEVHGTHYWGCFPLWRRVGPAFFPTGDSRCSMSVTSGVANRRATIKNPDTTMCDVYIKGRRGGLLRATPLDWTHYPSL